MKRGFFELIKESWTDYKNNFSTILIIFLIFFAVPSLILTYFGIPILNASTEKTLEFYATNQGMIYLTIGFAGMILSALMSASFISIAFSKEKLKTKKAISNGFNFLANYILLSILIFAILFCLFIPSIITGILAYNEIATITMTILSLIFSIIAGIFIIYFLIKWRFAYLILIGENKKVIESLKKSQEIVKGKWWKILGYSILLFITLFAISGIISLIAYTINYFSGQLSYVETTINEITTNQAILTTLGLFITQIFNLISKLITIALTIFFLKRFYSEIISK